MFSFFLCSAMFRPTFDEFMLASPWDGFSSITLSLTHCEISQHKSIPQNENHRKSLRQYLEYTHTVPLYARSSNHITVNKQRITWFCCLAETLYIGQPFGRRTFFRRASTIKSDFPHSRSRFKCHFAVNPSSVEMNSAGFHKVRLSLSSMKLDTSSFAAS